MENENSEQGYERRYEHRYERNEHSLSDEDLRKLKNSKVCIIGCGGLGGYIIETLGRIGVGNIIAVDGDVFDESNLNRQLLSTETLIGSSKAAAAKERMAKVNSEVNVDAVCDYFNACNAMRILDGCDIAIDALDNLDARLLLERTAAELNIPVIHGAISGWQGEATVCMPGSNALSMIYGIDTDSRDDVGDDAQYDPGNLPFTAAVISNIEASEAVKLLTGKESMLDGQLLMMDLLENEFEIVEIS